MKIAPDVENMMWMVAESADPQAVADFESRFPHLRYELSKRIDMVRKLKASGKMARPDGSIPQFVPPTRFVSPFGSRFRWSFAALALTALAFGSFYGTRMFMASRSDTKPVAPPKVIFAPLNGSETNRQPTDPGLKPEPDEPKETGIVQPEDEPKLVAKWEKPHDVRFEKIGLRDAIRAIAAQSGLKVDMPPDMPNDDIVVDYRRMSALEILQDMAPRFGFTVFDQGEGSVLVIPVREDGVPSSDVPNRKPMHPANIEPSEGR
jgi:hypothetical protein